MVQLNRSLASQDIFFTSILDVDRVLCDFTFVNLTSNTKFVVSLIPATSGDWYRAFMNLDISEKPVGMYALTITLESNSALVAQRLVYIAPNGGTPIVTNYSIYNSATNNVVYEG